MNVNNIQPGSVPAGGTVPVRKSGHGGAAKLAKGRKARPVQPPQSSSLISAPAGKVLSRDEQAWFEKMVQLPEGRLYADSGYSQPGGERTASLGKIIDRMV